MENSFSNSSFQKLADITLKTKDGCTFKAHKILLAQISKYFEKLFCGEFKPCTDEIFVPMVKGETLNELLCYIYQEKDILTTESVADVLLASDYLIMDDLFADCKTFILNDGLTVDNCIQVYNSAWKTQLKDIKANCKRYIKIHSEEAFSSPKTNISGLSLAAFKEILECDNLNISDESCVWNTMISWIKGNKPDGMNHFPELLKYIRLQEIDESLAEGLELPPTAEDNPFCFDSTLHSENQAKALSLIIKQAKKLPQTVTGLRGPRISNNIYFICKHFRGRRVELYITYDNNFDYLYSMGNYPMFREVGFMDICIGGPFAYFSFYNEPTLIKMFDLVNKTWTTISSVPQNRSLYSIVSVNDDVYALGGMSFMDNVDEIEFNFINPFGGFLFLDFNLNENNDDNRNVPRLIFHRAFHRPDMENPVDEEDEFGDFPFRDIGIFLFGNNNVDNEDEIEDFPLAILPGDENAEEEEQGIDELQVNEDNVIYEISDFNPDDDEFLVIHSEEETDVDENIFSDNEYEIENGQAINRNEHFDETSNEQTDNRDENSNETINNYEEELNANSAEVQDQRADNSDNNEFEETTNNETRNTPVVINETEIDGDNRDEVFDEASDISVENSAEMRDQIADNWDDNYFEVETDNEANNLPADIVETENEETDNRIEDLIENFEDERRGVETRPDEIQHEEPVDNHSNLDEVIENEANNLDVNMNETETEESDETEEDINETSVNRFTIVQRYNRETDSWQLVKPMHPMHVSKVVALNNNIYAIGESMNLDAMVCQVYHPNNDTWHLIPNPEFYRSDCAVVTFHGKLYLIGGHGRQFDELRKVEEYNPSKNLWRPLPDLPFLYVEPESIVIKNSLIVFDQSILRNESQKPVFWNNEDQSWCIAEFMNHELVGQMKHCQIIPIENRSVLEELTKKHKRERSVWGKSNLSNLNLSELEING
nr:uncharacterized protein LOC122270310 [Parasteatoda tepidariorum]